MASPATAGSETGSRMLYGPELTHLVQIKKGDGGHDKLASHLMSCWESSVAAPRSFLCALTISSMDSV